MIRTPSTGTNIPPDVQAGQRIRAQTTNDILAALRVNAKWHGAAGLPVPMYPDAPFRVFQYSRTSVWVVGGDWTRNGHKCTLTGQEVASLTAGPYYITLKLSHSDPTAHHAAVDPNVVSVTAEAALPSSDTYNTQRIIGYVECSGGYIINVEDWHRSGDIDDYAAYPDSVSDGLVTVVGKSLDLDPYAAFEIYGWHDAADAGAPAAADLFPCQDVSETGLPVAYHTWASLISAIAVDIIAEGGPWETPPWPSLHASLGDIDADTGPHYQVDHLTHFCNAAATNGEVPADATYARNYCYSLGNSDGDLTIDLDNTALYAAAGTECKLDWDAGKTYMWVGGSPLERIDWTSGMLYGEVGYVQHNSVNWASGQLQYGAAVMLDWWTSAGTQVDIGTTGAHKDLKVWGDVAVADVLDIDATDGLTVGGATPYSSESEHQIALPAGGYVRLKFKHGIAFAY